MRSRLGRLMATLMKSVSTTGYSAPTKCSRTWGHRYRESMMYIVLFLLVLLIPLPAQGGLKFSINYNDGTYGTADKCTNTSTFHCVPPNFQSVPHPDGITVTGTPFPAREGT